MVLNISKILLRRLWNVSNFPKMYISLKSNCLSLGVCSSFSLVLWKHRWYSWRMHLKPPLPWSSSVPKDQKFSCAVQFITHLVEVDGSFDFICHKLLRLVPYRIRAVVSDVGFAGCYHLVCHLGVQTGIRSERWLKMCSRLYWHKNYLLQCSRTHLYKEGRDLLGCVVVPGYAVNHPDCIDQTWDGVHHWNLQVNNNEPL